MSRLGFFLTIDGPGGVGKSTTVAALVRKLQQRGYTAHATTEPSRTSLGQATRELADEIHGEALALLVAADRRHHLDTEIRPHLAAGHVVVCDRYLASSLVLQRLDGVSLNFVQAINAGIDLPDLAVVLTAQAATITARLANRGAHHRFERDPANVQRELDLYGEAISILDALSVPVAHIDVTTLTAADVASAILHASNLTSATVAPIEPAPDPGSRP